jgi:hypothetical protein
VLRFAVLLIVAAISTAQAQEAKTVLGPFPPFSCGKWLNTPKHTAEYEVLKGWVLGYLSGSNMESAGADFLRDRDVDGLTAWIDNYCRRSPLHNLPQAIHELMDLLRAGR